MAVLRSCHSRHRTQTGAGAYGPGPALEKPLSKPSTLAWLAWLSAALFFCYAWVLRVSPSVIVGELMAELAAGGAIVGHLSAMYFYGYSGMQVPVGMLLDRFGGRRLITMAAAVCALGGVLFALSEGVFMLSAARFMIGAGAAFSLMGAIFLANQWLPARYFALLSGIAILFGMVGGMLGQGPVRLLVDAIGWRETMLLVATAGALLSIAAWSTVRDKPRNANAPAGILTGLSEVVRERQNWISALAGLGLNGPLLGFGALWGVPYLAQLLNVPPAQAAGIASAVLAGMGLGAPFFGWLSDSLGRRRGPLMGGISVCLCALALLLYGGVGSVPVALVCCFLIGFGCAAQIISLAFVRVHNPSYRAGTAVGLVNCMLTGAGALFQPLIGWLLDLRWDGTLADGTRQYRLDDFRFALSVLTVGLCMSLLLATRLDDPDPGLE